MLLLTVVSSQRRNIGSLSVHVFSEMGGTIGRSVRNDWTLPDDRHHLSSQHARIVHDGRGYNIIDTSTNGVYLNGRDILIGRNQSAQIRHGDRLYLADYVIDVIATEQVTRAALASEAEASLRPADDASGAQLVAQRGLGGDASEFWDALGHSPTRLPDDARARLMRVLGAAMREGVAVLAGKPVADYPSSNDRLPEGFEPISGSSQASIDGLDRTIRTMIVEEHGLGSRKEGPAL